MWHAPLCEAGAAHQALELALTQLAHESGADENPQAPDEREAGSARTIL